MLLLKESMSSVPLACVGRRTLVSAGYPSAGWRCGPFLSDYRPRRCDSHVPDADTVYWSAPAASNFHAPAAGTSTETQCVNIINLCLTTLHSFNLDESHLKFLELLFGNSVKDTWRVWQRGCLLRQHEPLLKMRVIIEKLLPETPRLLNPFKGAKFRFTFDYCINLLKNKLLKYFSLIEIKLQ